MARTGRPKADETKEKRISVRLNLEDYERLTSYAKASNKTISEVVQEGIDTIVLKNNK